MRQLRTKLGVKNLISDPSKESFDKFRSSPSPVYFNFMGRKRKFKPIVEISIMEILQRKEIVSIRKKKNSGATLFLAFEGEKGERKVKEVHFSKQEFHLLRKILKNAGGFVSLKQIHEALASNSSISSTRRLIKTLSDKIPELLLGYDDLFVINWSLLNETIVKKYVKKPEDLRVISEFSVSEFYHTIYFQDYAYRLRKENFKSLLFIFERPNVFHSFKDISNKEPAVLYNEFLFLTRALSPLGLDIRYIGGDEFEHSIASSSEKFKNPHFPNKSYRGYYGYFDIKEPNSPFVSIGDSSLDLHSGTLILNSKRFSLLSLKIKYFVYLLMKNNGKILPLSKVLEEFSSRIFELKELDQVFLPNILPNIERKMQNLFGKEFIPIKMSVFGEEPKLGYKLVHNLNPNWTRYFGNIELDPIYYKIRLRDEEISYPYLYFEAIQTILKNPELFIRNKFIQKLFFLLVRKSSLFVTLPISDLLTVFEEISVPLRDQLIESLERNFPGIREEIENNEKPRKSSPFMERQNLGKKTTFSFRDKIEFLRLHIDEAWSLNRIRREKNVHLINLQMWILDFKKTVLKFLDYFDPKIQSTILSSLTPIMNSNLAINQTNAISLRENEIDLSGRVYPVEDRRLLLLLPSFLEKPGTILSGLDWVNRIFPKPLSSKKSYSLNLSRFVSSNEKAEIQKIEKSFRSLFEDSFVSIKFVEADQLINLGYKLTYSLTSHWQKSLIFNIELDPISFRIKIREKEISLPFFDFYAFWIAIELIDSSPYVRNYLLGRDADLDQLSPEDINSLLILSHVIHRNFDRKSLQEEQLKQINPPIFIWDEFKSFLKKSLFSKLRSFQSLENIVENLKYRSWIVEKYLDSSHEISAIVSPEFLKNKINIIQDCMQNLKNKKSKEFENCLIQHIYISLKRESERKAMKQSLLDFRTTLNTIKSLLKSEI